MKNIVDFSALQIKIASPDKILEWSHGEVKEPETINYRSLKPEKDGLFDEKIFGPVKDFECHCGKYKRRRYKGIICDKCGVEVTYSRVRRERMGHIKLAAPIAHTWYFRGAPSKLSRLLDLSPRDVTAVIYFSQYIVLAIDEGQRTKILDDLDVEKVKAEENLREEAAEQIKNIKEKFIVDQQALKEKINKKETLQLKTEELEIKVKQEIAHTKQLLSERVEQSKEIYETVKAMAKRIKKKTVLSEDEYIKLIDYNAEDFLEVGMGAESLLKLVQELDLEDLETKLTAKIEEVRGTAKAISYIKRLKVVEGFKRADIDPAWMFITILPVLPPDLRPMVQLSGGRFAASDLNDLYRRVINRNNRLKHLIDLGAPDIILRNEKRMLQEAVDSLIDTQITRQRRASTRPLKSLSDMLKGKKGRFRRNLLGKRVDYSGRSVIIVGPELKLNECGLPKDMALDMFKPYVYHELIKQGIAPNVKSARNLVERREAAVYDVLEKVTKDHPVLLNRAPTLHKLGIQAFFPKLIDGNAIKIHPCVCSGYNADFDGDQMAIHIPLTKEAQQEAIDLMMATKNLLKPANSQPITIPNKEMAMGIYYYTLLDQSLPACQQIFADHDEAYHAQEIGLIDLRQPIKVRIKDAAGQSTFITTTVGRLEFNEIFPAGTPYLNEAVNAGRIKDIVTEAIETLDEEEVVQVIDRIKNIGFRAATLSGISVGVSDCKMITDKERIIAEANKLSEKVQNDYLNGLITVAERKKKNFDIWMETTENVANLTWDSYAEDNAVKVIINSGGTRASKDQVKQLAAMRGLVVDPLGNIVEMPTKSNFREGLTIFEYVNSARGSRKGLTDSALKTADAGYLTRRLVDVAHDSIIRIDDCGTTKGIEIDRNDRAENMTSRLSGRVALEDIKIKNKVVVAAGEVISPKLAEAIDKSGVQKVKVRSALTCEAAHGLCAKCYGRDFSSRNLVKIGTPVGVVAAQSIGEPGTQLTMRVKHSGGIVGLDVTQGLPRVEEIFEARTPKSKAIISSISGKVHLKEEDNELTIEIKSTAEDENETFSLPKTAKLLVEDKQLVYAGQPLTVGSIDPSELLKVKGLMETEKALVTELQRVYESQGISINDRHFEVIVRKMSDKVKIKNPGDTDFLTGEVLDRSRFIETNDTTLAAGGEPATAEVLLLGITRSALFTDSWMSAASFQHTKRVLTDAAAAGKIDYLEGLKENVIIGRLIPTDEKRARLDDIPEVAEETVEPVVAAADDSTTQSIAEAGQS